MIVDNALRILVLGASGQFGKRLCARLARQSGLHLFLGGRNKQKLERIREQLAILSPNSKVDILACDINGSQFSELLYARKLNLVVHLAGPFQGQDYKVAKACLQVGVSYMDMADGREFVTNFSSLDALAREKNISLITGASTVPGLSSAILDASLKDFSQLHAIDYGISAGLKTGLGLATLQAVLGYCGRPYDILRDGKRVTVYGLGSPRYHDFPEPVGRRFIVDCDIPDHNLFSMCYPTLKQIDFGSCIDVPGLAQILSFMSNCTRKELVAGWNFLSGFIKPFMTIVKPLGSSYSGFFMHLEGQDRQGKPKRTLFEIIAHDGKGLEIPVTPIMVLIRRMLKGEALPAGAYPCMGLFSLTELEWELSSYPIFWHWKDV